MKGFIGFVAGLAIGIGATAFYYKKKVDARVAEEKKRAEEFYIQQLTAEVNKGVTKEETKPEPEKEDRREYIRKAAEYVSTPKRDDAEPLMKTDGIYIYADKVPAHIGQANYDEAAFTMFSDDTVVDEEFQPLASSDYSLQFGKLDIRKAVDLNDGKRIVVLNDELRMVITIDIDPRTWTEFQSTLPNWRKRRGQFE